jgi:hypothetical protein
VPRILFEWVEESLIDIAADLELTSHIHLQVVVRTDVHHDMHKRTLQLNCLAWGLLPRSCARSEIYLCFRFMRDDPRDNNKKKTPNNVRGPMHLAHAHTRSQSVNVCVGICFA